MTGPTLALLLLAFVVFGTMAMAVLERETRPKVDELPPGPICSADVRDRYRR